MSDGERSGKDKNRRQAQHPVVKGGDGAVGVAKDVTGRRRAGDAVHKARDELELRVRERTADLARANAALQAEVAECRRVEAALRASEQRYRYMIETANEGIWQIDARADTVFVNRRMASMLGYTPQEMLGRSMFAFMGEDQREAAGFRLEQRRAGIAEQYDFRFRRKDGAPTWGMISASPVLDQEGRYEGALAMVTDITKRKRAERALRTSEERLRLLAENISEAFWIENPASGQLLYVSPAYEEIYGQTCESLYENPLIWKEAVHPEDMKWVDAALQKESRGEPARAEYRILCPDGCTRWVRRRSFPIPQEHGGFLVGGVAEDITERRQAEAHRIAYAVRQRDTLIREVHHRIKNNLQGVAGLLRNVAGEHPETAPFIDAAIAQIRSIGIVHGLHARDTRRGLRVGEVLMAIAGAVESLTGAHVVPHVILEGATPADIAEGEAVAVALILNELIMNAVKHGASHGHVSIDLECRPESASVRICNRGSLPAGFDFEAGYGTGVGLELVRSLLPRRGAHLSIARHGREVWALVELSFPTLAPPRSNDGHASGGSNR